ncbi:MAG: ribonuclease III domain-containing protein [Oscillospiraceae bacterium]|nr:ribonuclease III domain-containing protein [Oscillospiraceae bacterium]
MTESEFKMKNPSELAFIGDAVYELLARETACEGAGARLMELHRRAVGFVCAEAQADALERLLPLLSEEEADIVRRGKNAHKTAAPRAVSPKDYRAATGLEALFGYLYLAGRVPRTRELFSVIAAAAQGEWPISGGSATENPRVGTLPAQDNS